MYKLLLLSLFVFCFGSCSKEDHSLPLNEISGTWKYVGERAGKANAYFIQKDSADYYFRFAPDTYLRQRDGARICGSYFYSKGTLTLRIGKSDSSFQAQFLNDTLVLRSNDHPGNGFQYFIQSLRQLKNCN
ncbi:hypothetical protein QTN47_23030 [Danxiaibacter flavus]|uniref:Lipocalin-like domain-containing protein n=1 Tax=Danxiaibacter flavus TaxID=3049108 RepID=A0ABV3ZMT1_9BACT|nr:hypothetical protein QNM32_23035 [Chitinophagaceae bacterium DXS]